MNLEKDIQYIKGVGPKKAEILNKIGIYNLEDLITYFPRQHEDRGNAKNISELIDGEEALICAYPVSRMNEIKIRKNLTLCKLLVRDETGTCQITWYNQSYLKNNFKPNERYKFFGKVSNKYGKIDMQSPVFESEETSKNTGKIIPIYPLTYNLTQNSIRKIIENGLNEVDGKLEETLPDYMLDKYKLYNLNEAIHQIHFPNSFTSFNLARKRLVFEELLSMQLALLTLKNKYEIKKEGIKFDKEAKMSDIIDKIPFRLTKAQIRVLEEIDKDMESAKPMNRLLQGDVGSGKTIVAMISAYKAVKSGYQATIMAPTAILAAQHLESFTEILKEFNIKCELLVSGISKKKKEEILNKLASGEIDILIGTHAILEENVVFKDLGLVITDEQHRFGVRQRSIVASKGTNPDVLVMTATPIPRTLALILYGDLDISIIDELPPNRKKIETYSVTKGMENRVNNFVSKQIEEGRQAYIVCPLVEENEEINAKSVIQLAEEYKKGIFSNYKVEYLHGKMKPKEKDSIMEEFKNGNIDILISTTVIEVGVNVPNSNIMIIENAERFGLAQLHQLRGRVGRRRISILLHFKIFTETLAILKKE
jgi:ATP-dependent DNA helicase RecG